MLPIAILPVAGMLLGIGSSFTNINMLKTYGLMDIIGPDTIVYKILKIMAECGNCIFENLPLIFAVGVAIGMAKKEKAVAGLSAVIAFLIMHTTISSLIDINNMSSNLIQGATISVLGIQSLQMGVFGGIIVGLGVAFLHNKFYKIELHSILSFFGGTRFVPIISTITYIGVGIILFFVWPTIQNGIYNVGELVYESGYTGTFIYGFMERILIPFGLHHVFYLPFWQTAVGGTLVVDGNLIEGAQNIFFAQLASSNTEQFAVSATRFMSGKFPLMIFGLPAVALAMYRCANKDKKIIVKGILLSAGLTSMITGITEPIEFMFLFIAPFLYIIHCIGAGLAYMLMHILNVGVGMTFSGGLIDLILYGVMQGNNKTNWIMIVLVGICYFIVYYYLFKFIILKFDLKIIGRDDKEEKVLRDNNIIINKIASDDDVNSIIIKGLGGQWNIKNIDCCATRLRINVKDSSLVSDNILKSSGAVGVIIKGEAVQVVYGTKVSIIKSNLDNFLNMKESDILSKEDIIFNDKIEKNSNCIIYSPVKGRVEPLSKTPDEFYSQEWLGQGVVFFPSVGKILAPCDARVDHIAQTNHLIKLITDDEIEILIHIGIETVKFLGEPFNVIAFEGRRVLKGDLLIEFDLPLIKEQAKSEAIPMIFTNITENKKINNIKFGEVNFGEEILKII